MMGANIAGLAVLILFYLVILVVGVIAARKKTNQSRGENSSSLESAIVADRNINVLIGIFTMTATTVGGGYINGTAESIATAGLAWTLAPFGIFLGLSFGGLVYAKPMRDKRYMTMLDPLQERYGRVVVFLVYLAALCGDLFWTASILSALGTSLSVIVEIDLVVAIVTSAMVTITYTMVGQMISVAYTDVVQLIFIAFGLVLSVPFVMSNDHVGTISIDSSDWLGSVDERLIGQWADLFIAMTFGTIPWQAYFQRVLSVTSSRMAQVLSVVGGFSALVLVIPSILIGAAGLAADWNQTSLGISPMEAGKSSMVLPYVLQEFTPKPVSILGLGAISAAVMSSMDSAILGSSSMFTYNIYKQLYRLQASNKELQWVHRVSIFIIGALATAISISVPIIYGMFILAADIVFVIVLPQLTCVLFFKFTNAYGAVCGYVLGLVCRLGAGEYYISLPHFIEYPFYHEELGQRFPFRTFSVICSFITILVISCLTNFIFKKGILPAKFDILNCGSSVLYVPANCSINTDLSESTFVSASQSCDQHIRSRDHHTKPCDQSHDSVATNLPKTMTYPSSADSVTVL